VSAKTSDNEIPGRLRRRGVGEEVNRATHAQYTTLHILRARARVFESLGVCVRTYCRACVRVCMVMCRGSARALRTHMFGGRLRRHSDDAGQR